MSLRRKLILIVAGLAVLGIGSAVGATFGALQDWDSDSYGAQLAAISPRAAELQAAGYDELTSRVARVAIVSSVVTVLAIVVLSWFAVKRGLRPLADIADTADEIRSGDLSRRVPSAKPGTEIGRLDSALNAMLGQLENAFQDKENSEARLRRFVADASHELRTPIATIRGYAELFRRGAAERPADLAKVTGRIEAEAERMGVLVDELLLLARLDQGRPLEREPVDLTELAADAVADARATEPSRSLELDADGPVVVSGDPARLRQVLANLLSNVLRHTPSDAPATIRVHPHGDGAMIEVIDTGPGMSEAERARAFERFYRTDSSRAKENGSGLGLSIVDSVVEAHGGTVELTTQPGQGTTVRVTLPQMRESRAQTP
ncbi:two-component system OmpR family sensor kinase [Herbihabitans rhizosphaerae]|uniref:histidine kinase n=1 Tax=Herbihabitans rhizosphaerae TaxID=1872711 RepID=A0A4Q7KCJ2_9PSEU|nr:HAMP domain-containing sensor histidine kinase [Herbihabitans rhizosphaerae]RZS29608.1 two-component system OmpR family sensor kinase [Herbihabitans rhizosphaerae]